MLRMHVLRAVFLRNVQSYFTSALGYLIIVVFVVAGAFLAFNPLFFTNNLANLDQLSLYFPMLLLFLIPAITMTAWSEEKKQGTEELLFTLPASDVEILLGKYAASLAVYTAGLLFSLSHFIVLLIIGEPDVPLTMATYFGYWLAGAALISVGMFASVLTNSATIAFVLGTALCAIPVFIGRIASDSDVLQVLSLAAQLKDFTLGLVPLSGVLYFVSLTIFFLYLNYIMISRRHWSNSAQEHMGGHYTTRGLALGVLLCSLLYANNVVGLLSLQADATREQIYSLSATTRTLISRIEAGRPVTIQAFISSDVPREYVDTRNKLIGLLKQYDRIGEEKIDVRIVNVEVYSDEANEAETLGINPTSIITENEGRRQEVRIYMGAVLTSSYDEVIIPLIGPGTPIEYELTRSLQTVSNSKRLTVGVLSTEANVMSGGNSWEIIRELKKQYDVKEVSPSSEIVFNKPKTEPKADEPQEGETKAEASEESEKKEGIDVLLAILPSSLPADQLDRLVKYVEEGHPAVILDDPMPLAFNNPFTGIMNTPRKPDFSEEENPLQPEGGQSDDGKTLKLLEALGLKWQYDQITWDTFNPHPEFETVPPEFLFITPKNGNPEAISSKSEITSGLQEVMAFFAGTVKPVQNSEWTYQPLLATGTSSGLLDWKEFTTASMNMLSRQPSVQIKPNRDYVLREENPQHVIACEVTGDKRNVVYVADIDIISDFFFQERRTNNLDFNLDNVTFILNAIDKVAGVDDFISLRKRRAKLRTLTYVEQLTADFTKQLTKEREKATEEAKQELANRENINKEKKQAILESTEMSDRLKQVRLEQLEQSEERQKEVDEAIIEQEKETRIEKARAESQRNIRNTENKIRYWAIFLSPLPALILGVLVVSLRVASERQNIAVERRVKNS
ncbi:MAG: Gldg family protein [Planctomycetaceae bacterium]|nr:Gldg family protein [Planctomycetaceae bacterium]